MPEHPTNKKTGTAVVDSQEGEAAPVKKARKTKAYVPTLRSGPYAIILALATLNEESVTGLTKQQTIDLAQPYCDSSFSAPSDPTKFYTAWNSIKTLLSKDLVWEKGRPLRRYGLTEEGWEVAKRIKQTVVDPGQQALDTFVDTSMVNRGGSSSKTKPTSDPSPTFQNSRFDDEGFLDLESSPEPIISAGKEQLRTLPWAAGIIPNANASEEAGMPTFSPITISPGSFTVNLVLDVREVRAKTDRDYMQEELTKKGVKPTMRALEVGDALWVAKLHDPGFLSRHGAEGDEVVLDWIVERKRLDDLVGSIKDGRFHEQKFRLRKSGVKNVIYIIEEISMNADHFQRYEEAVESAIAGAQVVNGYFVKKTQKMDDTIRYLARMTLLLKGVYEKQPLYVIPTGVLTNQNYLPLLSHLKTTQPSRDHHISYPALASLASKSGSLTLRDVFLKMLMCTRGVTGEKALEIQKRWKTPVEFVEAFDACGNNAEGKKRKAELVMSKMGDLVGRKKIAKIQSTKIAEVWGDL